MIYVKKLPIIIFLTLLSCLSVHAGEELVFHLKSGGQITFAMEENPVITFEGENMLVKSKTVNYSVPIGDINSYDFSETTEIEQVQKKPSNPAFANGHVVFSQLKTGNKVYVYAIDGRQLRLYAADSTGTVDVDLTTLPKGLYVLRSPDTTIKIINR